MTHVRSTVLRSLAAGSAVALACIALTPASATPQSHALQTTLVSAGDPDGSGTGFLEIHTKREAICYQIHTENVTTPITGATITLGPSGDTIFELIVLDRGADIDGCTGVSRHSTPTRRDLNRITKDPGSYHVHLFNDEHPSGAGAIQGQLANAA